MVASDDGDRRRSWTPAGGGELYKYMYIQTFALIGTDRRDKRGLISNLLDHIESKCQIGGAPTPERFLCQPGLSEKRNIAPSEKRSSGR